MGSSIFHGAASTFLAICVLGGSSSYIFLVFFRMWVGIILFASANGFLLLPVVLSYIGPTKDHIVPEKKLKSNSKVDSEEKCQE